jgi:hypothetical protein
MKIVNLAASVLFGIISATTFAQTPQEASIKKLLEARLGDGAVVDSITKTPYAGLFEVRAGRILPRRALTKSRKLNFPTCRSIPRSRWSKETASA